MATINKNLSDFNPTKLPNAEVLKEQRYAIVVSEWNEEVTLALMKGAHQTFVESGVLPHHIDVFYVPGTFELTNAAKRLLTSTLVYSAVVVIGCVIQGDTPHFDYVCQGVTQGITQLNAQQDVPVIFSVLTTLTLQQALDRAGGIHGNKGTEGAITAIKMANLFA